MKNIHGSATPALLQEARDSFSGHCASCHGKDGDGRSGLGLNLYPKATDLRQLETQNLTDGEIHYIITPGARLTGMPARLIVFDTETGKEVASMELGEKGVVKPEIVGITDDLSYDTARSCIYVLNALGSIDVFQQKDPDHYALIASVPTPLNTKTGLFVPDLEKLFVAVVRQGKEDAETRVYRTN